MNAKNYLRNLSSCEMDITPRENLLRTLRCENPEWMPVCLHLFPNENPTQGVPSELKDLFASTSGFTAGDILSLGEYFGAEDYMLPVPQPGKLVSERCYITNEQAGEGRVVTTMTTPKGELRQITMTPEGRPALVTERYAKTTDDIPLLMEYFSSLYIEPDVDALKRIRKIRELAGEKGVLFCRSNGTPLGMCYRVYSGIVDLIYMIADAPGIMDELFACMEEKYFELYDFMLREAFEIDVYYGMDDTSTSLISPHMFELFNVELTNRRADLCHRYGKVYMHHSCGLIHDLLPIYRKTRMDGVDAFTPPPIGNVSYTKGRKILGPDFSIITGLANGLRSGDEDVIRERVTGECGAAAEAGNFILHVGGPQLTFPAMEMIFTLASSLSKAGR